jgi:hypothetical protein
MLTVTGCTGGAPNPTMPPATTAAPAPVSPTPTGRTYQASALDLCNKTDLAPLADLSLKVEKRDDSPPNGGPGAACFFQLKTADGHLASLRVEAMVLGSQEEAVKAFNSQQNVTVLKPDATISGLGDQAEGRTLDSEPSGFKQSEYMVHLRSGNMTVKAWISVGGNAYTPKQTLATKAETIARATFTTASTAWLQP